MKRRNPFPFVLVAVMSLLLAAPAAGFGPMGGGGMGADMPEDMWGGAEFKPVVGLWAEYLITLEDEETSTFRISIVGEEDGAYWYETQIENEDMSIITKSLVSGDPEDEGATRRMIFKSGDDPAMEMPVDGGPGGMMKNPMAEMGGMPDAGEATEVEKPDVTPVDLGIESITVPAGTFDARHTRVESDNGSFDMWMSAEAGPYGVVKSTSPDFEMILTAHGDDATSAITEEPQKFEIPSFGIPGMGG